MGPMLDIHPYRSELENFKARWPIEDRDGVYWRCGMGFRALLVNEMANCDKPPASATTGTFLGLPLRVDLLMPWHACALAKDDVRG